MKTGSVQINNFKLEEILSLTVFSFTDVFMGSY